MAGSEELEQTTFTAMRQASREDYQKIGRHSLAYLSELPGRILTHLELLSGATGGYAVARLPHSAPSATAGTTSTWPARCSTTLATPWLARITRSSPRRSSSPS